MTKYSLAQLTVLEASPPELIRIAGEAGYDFVGLRLLEVTGGDAWPLANDARLMRESRINPGQTHMAERSHYERAPAANESGRPYASSSIRSSSFHCFAIRTT